MIPGEGGMCGVKNAGVQFACQVTIVDLLQGKRERQQQVAVTGSSPPSEANWNESIPDVEASERDGFHLPVVTCLLPAFAGLGMGSLPCHQSSLPCLYGVNVSLGDRYFGFQRRE